MSNPFPPRRSLFGPLLLIGLGVVILLRHFVPSIPLSEWMARYWPVLLILWGVARLVEYFRHGSAQPRMGLSGGEIFLLLLIILCGLAFSASWRYRNDLFRNNWGVDFGGWDPFQHSYHFTASASSPFSPGKTVVVRSDWGDIQILASSDGLVHADLEDSVHAANQERAQTRFQQQQPLIQATGNRIVVRPAGSQPDGRVKCNLKLSVPAGTDVIADTRRGDISVSNWTTGLTLSTGNGSVSADHIHGDLQVSVHGDSVNLDQITGNVGIQGNGDDVSLSNIDGVVSLEGEYSGDLSFQNLSHGITFSSSRTGLRIGALPGTVDADRGDLNIVNASDIHLRTRDKDIEVHRFSGVVEIADLRDSVSLSTDVVPTQPITVSTRGGDIALAVPPASRFALHASARRGSISSDFGIQVSENGSVAVATTSGQGPAIRLETADGSIAIRKHTGAQTAPAAPSAPAANGPGKVARLALPAGSSALSR